MIRRLALAIVIVGVGVSIAHAQSAAPVTLAAPVSSVAPVAPVSSARPDTGYIGASSVALEIDDCGVKLDVPADDLRARASEHYQRGEVLYVQGDYRGAVNELVASYCLLPYFSVLKDIGQAYERQLDYPRAIAYLGRYIKEIPDDAKQTGACGVDPQVDRANVSARIQVLSELRAHILIDTQPTGAAITLTSDGGVTARATSGQAIEVRGGRYELAIELPGFHRVERTITFEIGKPYTLFEQLEPIQGRLHVQVTPNDARIFVDNRFVGVARYDAPLPGGTYTVASESEGRITDTRKVTVLPGHEDDEVITLPAEPQVGRRQLMVYAGIAGGATGSLLLGATTNKGFQAIGFAAGVAGGLLGGYYGIPSDQPLGTSSLTITSSLAGGIAGAAIAQLLTDHNTVQEPFGGAGVLIGAGVGYWAGSRTNISPGDAALINSGVLWGSFTGGLFTYAFNTTSKANGGLVLGGLAMGGIGGALLAHNVPITRTHAVLIDVAGLVGVLGGLAIESVVYQGTGTSMTDQVVESGRLANWALGGMAIGLIAGGVLTRNLDAPQLSLTPTIGNAATSDGKSALTYGFGGQF